MKLADEKRLLECGYVSSKALDEVGGLTLREVRLLAAMAITLRDSPFSDSNRDLERGLHELTGVKPYWWTVREELNP